jgi:hypothetical protein
VAVVPVQIYGPDWLGTSSIYGWIGLIGLFVALPVALAPQIKNARCIAH